MSTLRVIRAVIAVMSFALRHFLIVITAFIAGCLLWTLAYLGLLLVAVIGNPDLGGILAYPFGILGVALFCVLGSLVFLPSCGFASILCGLLRWPKLSEIPLAFFAAFGIEYVLHGVYVRYFDSQAFPSIGDMFEFHGFFVSCSAPLNIGQPFVLFRLRGCIVVGGIGSVRGI